MTDEEKIKEEGQYKQWIIVLICCVVLYFGYTTLNNPKLNNSVYTVVGGLMCFAIFVISIVLLMGDKIPQWLQNDLSEFDFKSIFKAKFNKKNKEEEEKEMVPEDKQEQGEEEEEPEEIIPEERKEPETLEDWDFEMLIRAWSREKEGTLEEAYEKIKELVSDDEGVLEYEIKYHEYKVKYLNKQDDIELIKKYTKEDGDFSDFIKMKAWASLGRIYRHQDKNIESIKAYEEANKFASDEEHKAIIIGRKADNLYRLNKKADALNMLSDYLNTFSDDKALKIIYQEMADLYGEIEDHNNRALALEKVIELGGSTYDSHFKIAYSYSEIGLEKLALHHYKKAIYLEPESNSMALNNLGVAYDALKMPISSTESYRKAFEKGNSLSGANLAYKLLDGGFVDEAKKVIEESQKLDEPHENVGKAFSAITQNKEKEEGREKDSILEARNHQQFFRGYAEKRLIPKEWTQLKANYIEEDGEKVSIKIDENKIIGVWSKKGYSDTKYNHKFEGKLINSACEVEFYEEDFMGTFLKSFKKDKEPVFKKEDIKAYLYIEDEENIKILKQNKYDNTRFELMIIKTKEEEQE